MFRLIKQALSLLDSTHCRKGRQPYYLRGDIYPEIRRTCIERASKSADTRLRYLHDRWHRRRIKVASQRQTFQGSSIQDFSCRKRPWRSSLRSREALINLLDWKLSTRRPLFPASYLFLDHSVNPPSNRLSSEYVVSCLLKRGLD